MGGFTDTRQLSPHYFSLIWLLIATFAGFSLFVAWDTGLLTLVYRLDRSYIALLITALALGASVHAAWHVLGFSRHIEALVSWLDAEEDDRDRTTDDPFTSALLADLAEAPEAGLVPARPMIADSDSILEIHADRLRSPVELGWFLVDLAVRLGLVGTIVGFILIFTSLSDTSVSGAEGIKDLLVAMSSGMGTALFTTLTGLIAGSLLSVQYLVLGRQAETLVGLMIRVRNRLGKLPVPLPADTLLPDRAQASIAETRPP